MVAGLLDGLTAHQRYKRGIGQQADQFDKATPSPVDMSRYDGEVVNRGELFPIGEYKQPDGSNKFGLAWPGILSGDLPQMGDRSPEAVQAYGRAALSGVMLPGAGRAAAGVPSNAVGIFGGRLAKTADQAALAKAEELAAKGAPREQIWTETGWFQGPDKKWRFEIDDSGARLNEWTPAHGQANAAWPNRKGPVTELSTDAYINHPELARAYWPTRDSEPGFFFAEQNGYAGRQHPGRNGDPGSIEIGIRTTLDPQKQRSTSLHELQHEIQDREGFARGASKEQFKLPQIQIDGGSVQLKEFQDAILLRGIAERMKTSVPDAAKFAQGYHGVAPVGRAVEIAGMHQVDKLQSMYEKAYGRLNDAKDPSLAYRRTAGEVEARTVQKRADMTAAERRARFPWLDYDVPESKQIIRGILP